MPTLRRALLIALVLAGPALGSDIRPQDLAKLWGKYGVEFGERPKMGASASTAPTIIASAT